MRNIPHIYYEIMSTDHVGMIEKKIQTIEFLLRDESDLLHGLRESIYKKFRRHTFFCFKTLEQLTPIQSLVEDILKQLDDLYMLGVFLVHHGTTTKLKRLNSIVLIKSLSRWLLQES